MPDLLSLPVEQLIRDVDWLLRPINSVLSSKKSILVKIFSDTRYILSEQLLPEGLSTPKPQQMPCNCVQFGWPYALLRAKDILGDTS
jgi:hypothetical protein